MTWKVGFQPRETNISLIPKVLKQLRGICEFCRDTCSRFSQQATIALLWGLQKIKSGELMRLQQPPTISPERKKRGRTRQRNETALEKCWFLALGLWAWQRSNKKPSSDLLRFCYTPQTRNTKSLKSKLSEWPKYTLLSERSVHLEMNILQTWHTHFTSIMWHIFASWNWIFMVENVGILKLSIRIDWIGIMWPLQTNGPKTTKLSVNAYLFFLLHTEAAKSVIHFIYNVLQLKNVLQTP